MLATNVGARPKVPGTRIEIAEGLASLAIARAIDDSLRRLRTDHVDLSCADVDDRSVPQEDRLRGLRRSSRPARPGRSGPRNLRAWRLALAQDVSARHGPATLAGRHVGGV